MKKTRIILTFLAFTFAIIGAYNAIAIETKRTATATGYIQKSDGSTVTVELCGTHFSDQSVTTQNQAALRDNNNNPHLISLDAAGNTKLKLVYP